MRRSERLATGVDPTLRSLQNGDDFTQTGQRVDGISHPRSPPRTSLRIRRSPSACTVWIHTWMWGCVERRGCSFVELRISGDARKAQLGAHEMSFWRGKYGGKERKRA